MVVDRRLDASGRTTRITMDSGDDAVNAVCSGPQLTSSKLWLCSEMTTTSFADAEDDGVRPSVWMNFNDDCCVQRLAWFNSGT